MTSATNTPSALPRTEDRGPRESVIRDLYALAAFYSANPDFPLPWTIRVYAHADLNALTQLAEQHETEIYGADQKQIDFEIGNTAVPVVLMVNVPREERPL